MKPGENCQKSFQQATAFYCGAAWEALKAPGALKGRVKRR
jgi:hypothetical protein